MIAAIATVILFIFGWGLAKPFWEAWKNKII